MLWHIVETRVFRPFYDMELFIDTCGARKQIVAHLLASRHTPHHDLQRLGKDPFRHMVGVVRDDLDFWPSQNPERLDIGNEGVW